ncbi:MAG TPA: hypothetical protein VEK08_24100 [Planctomycetota bacterium]|nr:hypothetical protein [Planctomycetota bacterium]
MAMSELEATASLRIMILVAKADGTLHEDERASLSFALQGIPLPKGASLQNLLDEESNLDAQLKLITSSEGQETCYTSAYAIANADGDCTPEEKKILEHIKTTYKLSEEKTTLVGRLFAEAKDTVLPSNIKAINDPKKRAEEIKEDTLKYAVMCSVLGAFPIPGLAILTDLAAVGLQVKLVRDIGQYFGHQIDKPAAKSLLLGVGIGTGARIAVTNLCKFVPMFGSAVGAAASFAATYAVGKMAVAYFENGCKADMETLKKAFRDAEKEGKEQYAKNKDVIATKQKEQQKKIEQLASDRKAGKITEAEYEKKIAELV